MSEQTNGDGGLKAEEQLAKFTEKLDDYSAKSGLPVLSYDKDVYVYLAMPKEMIEAKTAEDCGEIAYILSAYALYLRKQYNRNIAIVNWAKYNLNRICGRVANNYKDFKFLKMEQQFAVVAKENEYAKKVFGMMREADAKATEFEDMHQHVRNVTDTLIELQRTKRAKKYESFRQN